MRRFLPFALRDVGVLALSAVAWWLDAELRSGAIGGAAPTVAGVAAGALSFVAAFVLHEWGHLLGAVHSGAVVHAPTRLWSIFLFYFDTGHSTRRQFLAMSWGGYAASTLALVAILLGVPWSALSGQVALALTAVGFVATLSMEFPMTIRVWKGAPLPRGGVYVCGSD